MLILLLSLAIFLNLLETQAVIYKGDYKSIWEPCLEDNFSIESHTSFESFIDTSIIRRENTQYLTTGTTIVGLCCKEGVVLGSDTRSTGGPVVMDKNKQKVHFIAPKVSCCAAGTSADCDQLTRLTSKILALQKVNSYFIPDSNTYSVAAAAELLCNFLQKDNNVSPRTPSAVFILGGIDCGGPRLFQIESNGLAQRIPYGAKGSGATDALAVLESGVFNYSQTSERFESLPGDDYVLDIKLEDAIELVRKAVQAGILNDLGSGSHVDLCVMPADKQLHSKYWRENMLEDSDESPRSDEGVSDASYAQAPVSSSGEDSLGKQVWSKHFRRPRMLQGKIVYSTESNDQKTKEKVDIDIY